jgi:hypothetical protein
VCGKRSNITLNPEHPFVTDLTNQRRGFRWKWEKCHDHGPNFAVPLRTLGKAPEESKTSFKDPFKRTAEWYHFFGVKKLSRFGSSADPCGQRPK